MTNAPSGAGDRYYVYRPMLDLTGKSGCTDKGHGYNGGLVVVLAKYRLFRIKTPAVGRLAGCSSISLRRGFL